MIIWLRQHAAEPLECGARLGVGVEGEVVRREALARLVELDQGYLALQQQHREVLASAHDEAAALLARAADDARGLRDAAQREFDGAATRGFEAGRHDALAEWYGHTARILAQRHAMQTSLSTRIAELVVAAVEKIVVAESPAALFARAAQALERIVDGGSYLRVRVHPDQREEAVLAFERVAAHWHELGQRVPLTVSADRTLALGACLCETDIGSIDASLEVQLDAIRTAVARAAQRAGGEQILPEDCVARIAPVSPGGAAGESAAVLAPDVGANTDKTNDAGYVPAAATAHLLPDSSSGGRPGAPEPVGGEIAEPTPDATTAAADPSAVAAAPPQPSEA
jgi:type III secretion protein L